MAKFHKHALYTDLAVYPPSPVTRSQRTTVVLRPRVNNDDAISVGTTIQATLPQWFSDLHESEQQAVAMLMAYIHECGEHVTIEGIELNHHKPGGVAGSLRALRHVVRWLEEHPDR